MESRQLGVSRGVSQGFARPQVIFHGRSFLCGINEQLVRPRPKQINEVPYRKQHVGKNRD